VRGDRALVIGYDYGGGPQTIDDAVVPGEPYYSEPKTVLTEVDISDASALRVVRTETIEGLYVSARMTGDTARVVVSSTPRALADPALEDRAAGWRPRARVVNRRTGRKRTRPLAGCRSIRRPKVFSGLNNLTVLTIDMSRGLPGVDADSILTDGQLIYGSTRNLYVATQRWVDAPDSPDEEPPKLSTAIHKFDASEPGQTSYVASGTVRGSLLSQWSFSDHRGELRVASTDSPLWWEGDPRPQSESFVTVFREDGDRLAQVGQVGGIGVGERIYAVRFIGDVGYVVTFRQVDPLHTLDLSDPEHPRVAGELKIRGYSAYLHPLGGDLLLGVGQDATEQGGTLGTQLSLFDVGDPAHPARLHHRVVEGGSSDVEFDHHAFLWWGPAKLAVLPVQVWDYKEGGGDRFFGAIGFHVERGGIDEAGRASHTEDGDYDGRILRSLVVDGRLFTLSNRGVELNDLATLERKAWVPFQAP
jgi:Beta propeller domain